MSNSSTAAGSASGRTGADVVAVIPARGGSKGVPGKNLAEVGGRSLLARAVASCLESDAIDLVVVSTDDEDIGASATDAGAVVVERPAELSGDTATSESALLHAIDQLEADGLAPRILVFVQCTSPFIDPKAIGRAVHRVSAGDADSVLSAVESYHFLWRISADGAVAGVNHDPSLRPRRQDRDPDWVETGAFYVMRVAGFKSVGHRFFGTIGIEPVSQADAIEIDTHDDLDLARALAALQPTRMTSLEAVDLASIDVLVTDFDGVHTDDMAYVDQHGSETVRVNRRDGHGVRLLREAGVTVLVLSTETNPVVARRADKLRVECLHGIEDKGAALVEWAGRMGFALDRIAYLGNDVNDLGCLDAVGYPMCVADAHPAVRAVASHVTVAAGGAGAVREVAESILAARGLTSA